MEQKQKKDIRVVYLISREENCTKEVIDFLLKSECASLGNIGKKSNDVEAITEYTLRYGPPTVTNENWLGNGRVHFVLKPFDPNDYEKGYIINYRVKCHAVIMFLSDEADIELILNLMRGRYYYTCLGELENLTVIGKWSKHILQSIEAPFHRVRTTRWSWKGRIAYNWSYDLPVKNNLWFHICGFSGNNGPTRVSYNSENIFRLKQLMFYFLDLLLQVIYSNINVLSIYSRMEANGIWLETLSWKDPYYCVGQEPIKDLLMQFNVSNLSEFISVLKEEVKQLACHLPRLVILCDEILMHGYDPHTKMFYCFEKIEDFKGLYNKELQSVNKEDITQAALHSLNAMSRMKYTGQYIKTEFGTKKLNALKEHFRFRNVESDFLYITETIMETDHRIQDIHIENRIGNIQLLKLLQGTLQEFTEDLKDVRHLQEDYIQKNTEDIREIKEKLSYLEQKLDEVSMKTKK